MRIRKSIGSRSRGLSLVELSRLQETARYALDLMVKDIRMAGYFGCADRLDTVTLNVPIGTDGELWDFNLDPAGTIVPPVEGLESTAVDNDEFQPSGFTVTLDADAATDGAAGGNAGHVLPGTDALTLRYLAGSMDDLAPANGTLDYQVTADAISGVDTTITVDSTTGFIENQVAAIADCGGSDIFQINAAPTATTLQANEISRGYNATSSPMIAPFVGVRYFIGDNGRAPAGEIAPSLYRTIIRPDLLQERSQELFEGVEQMEILYGVDDDGDGVPNSYVIAGDNPLDAANPGNWANVVAVRIAILVRTVDEHGRDVDTKNDYNLHETLFGPYNDRRRRRVFTTTAMVRNL